MNKLKPEEFVESLLLAKPVVGCVVAGSVTVDVMTVLNLDLRRCVIEGDLELSSHAEDELGNSPSAVCARPIDLSDAVISGRLLVRGFSFAIAEQEKEKEKKSGKPVALCLDSLRCAGSIRLERLACSPMDGRISRGLTLQADGLRCQGDVFIKAISGFDSISLQRTRIDGRLEISDVFSTSMIALDEASDHAAISSLPNGKLTISGSTIGDCLALTSIAAYAQVELDMTSVAGSILISLVSGATPGSCFPPSRIDEESESSQVRTRLPAESKQLSAVASKCDGGLHISEIEGFSLVNLGAMKCAGMLSVSQLISAKLDLTRSTSPHLNLDHCVLTNATAFGCEFGFVVLSEIRAENRISFRAASIGRDLHLVAVDAVEIDISRASIHGSVIVKDNLPDLARSAVHSAQATSLLATDQSAKDAETSHGLLRNASGFPIFTSLSKLVLEGVKADAVDVRGAYFRRVDGVEGAPLNLSNCTVTGAVVLRSIEFAALTGCGSRQEQERRLLVDFSGADIRMVDLPHPLPSGMSLVGSSIGSWGIEPSDAKAYERIFSRMIPFDRMPYIQAEEALERAGVLSEADKLHLAWRRLVRREQPLVYRIFSTFLDAAIGYGTKPFRLVLIMVSCSLIAGLVWYQTLETSFIVNPSMLATLAECGVRCDGFPLPEVPKEPWPRFLSVAQLVLSNVIPIVDLGFSSPLIAAPGTVWPWTVFFLRAFGWIAWPVLITSLVAGLFPRRYR